MAASIVTQYVFLTAFMLMGVEGWLAYHAVIQVFNIEEVSMVKLNAVAYVVPVLIISTTGIISAVLGEEAFGGKDL